MMISKAELVTQIILNDSKAVRFTAPCDDYRTNPDGLLLYAYKKGQYFYPALYLNIDNMIVVAAASQGANGNVILNGRTKSPLELQRNFHIAEPNSDVVSTIANNYSSSCGGRSSVVKGSLSRHYWSSD